MPDIRVPNRLNNSDISIFFGVIAGFAYKLQFPVFWLRIIAVVSFISAPYLIFLYFIFFWHMKEDKSTTKEEFDNHINAYQNEKT